MIRVFHEHRLLGEFPEPEHRHVLAGDDLVIEQRLPAGGWAEIKRWPAGAWSGAGPDLACAFTDAPADGCATCKAPAPNISAPTAY